ncbi:serine proteinase stubble isoform X2 [Bombyx mori]|uniref:serine proteinase stubble isoform X2 n=1 Tax=Bombyx mori TaxID=7091 RepID=UPI002ED370BC
MEISMCMCTAIQSMLKGPVPIARNIRHLPCISRKTGQEGLCMFAIDCLKANGTHLGACVDRFYFGSCCQLSDKTTIPQIVANHIDDNSIDSFIKDDKLSNKIPEIFATKKTTTEKTATTLADQADAVQDRTESMVLETKSDEQTTVFNKITDNIKLTTALNVETTTRTEAKHTEAITEVPVRLSTFQTVSVGSNTEKSTENGEKIKTTTTKPSSTTEKVTKPVKVSMRPTIIRPTYKPYNYTRPQYTQSTYRPSKPVSIKPLSTRKPPYRPPTKRPTRRPLPSPPRLNITILPQTTPKPPKPINLTTEVATDKFEPTEPLTSTTNFETTTNKPSAVSEDTTEKATVQEEVTERVTKIETEAPTSVPSSTSTEFPPFVTWSNTVGATTKAPEKETESNKVTESDEETWSPITPPAGWVLLSTVPPKPDTSSTTTTTTNQPIIQETTEVPETTFVTETTVKHTTTIKSTTTEPTTVSNELITSTTTPKPVTTEKVVTTTPEILTTQIPLTTTTKFVTTEKPLTTPAPTTTTTEQPKTTRKPTTTTKKPDTTTQTTTTTTTQITTTTTPTTTHKPATAQPPTTSTEKPITTTEKPVNSTGKPVTSSEAPLTEVPTEYQTISTSDAPVLEFTVNVTLTPSPSSTEAIGLTTLNAVSSEATTEKASNATTEAVLESTTQTADVETTTEFINMSDYKNVCGRRLWQAPQSRIVGGDKSTFGMWPWQISLRQYRTSTYLHKCGAALLNENWAITAAHCVEHVPPSELLVRLGEHDLANEDEPYGFAERRVQIIASHPHFDPATFEYDLALLRFYEPVKFQPNILPVCVPDNDDDYVGKTAYVTGWGRLYDEGPLPSVLQEVRVPVINNTACEAMYQAAGYNEHIPNIFICAGRTKGGTDSCEGDSGGPMVVRRDRDDRFVLGGIISWGIGCAEPNQPGVYTRISEFRDWINQILQF